jgi:BirA family biotin operon repressor/biotin-[acetyl-CoA-carboxylase] ligase
MRADRLVAALGRPVLVFAELDSTNRFARHGLQRGALDAGDVIVADVQTAGRGRLGRSWLAEPGQNLLFSLILAPKVPVAEAPRCVLHWAAAMAEALGCAVKWPNDLVDDQDQKLGGVLAELELGEEGRYHVILGVGLNVNQVDFPGLPGASSLRGLHGGAPLDREALLIRLVLALESADLHGDLRAYAARCRTLGKTVRVAGREGLATGLGPDGALLIDGIPVLTGDVELLSGDVAPTPG